MYTIYFDINNIKLSLQQWRLIEMSCVAQTREFVYTANLNTFLECVYIHCLQKSIKALSNLRIKYLK